jgi:hypothetical protein
MNVLTNRLLIIAILSLIGCGEQSQSNKSETSTPSAAMDEVTRLGEIPSVLGEGLTAEEKAELKDQILPAGVGDVEAA